MAMAFLVKHLLGHCQEYMTVSQYLVEQWSAEAHHLPRRLVWSGNWSTSIPSWRPTVASQFRLKQLRPGSSLRQSPATSWIR